MLEEEESDAKKRLAPPANNDGGGGGENKRAKQVEEDQPPFVNEYNGFDFSSCAASPPATIDRVEIADVTPESFFENYVSKRKPCVIVGQLNNDDPKWAVSERWTSSSYLKSKAGDVEISVERREPASNEKFGKGNETKMPFGKFLDAIDSGDDSLYLTTQDVKTDRGGRPRVLSPFMVRLSDDFPVCPKLTGNLIPQNINVWMGCCNQSNGSSSGLHHDFHDNLYCIVEGRKKLDLYAPSDAQNLYTRGKLVRIHKNGRINYEGEETNADGSHAQAEKALDASLKQETAVKELEAAEAAVEAGEDGAKERLEKAEKALDEAMEAVMDAEVDDDGGEGGEDGEDFWEATEKRKQELLAKGASAKDGEDTKEENDDGDVVGNDEDLFDGEDEEERTVDKTVKNPLNFSLVDTTLDSEALQERFPLFAKATKATVELLPNQMLYLPASWFHEVTSYGGDGDKNNEKNGKEGKGRHIAFNYWFHPPDGSVFDAPYSSSFWENDWSLRRLDEVEQPKTSL